MSPSLNPRERESRGQGRVVPVCSVSVETVGDQQGGPLLTGKHGVHMTLGLLGLVYKEKCNIPKSDGFPDVQEAPVQKAGQWGGGSSPCPWLGTRLGQVPTGTCLQAGAPVESCREGSREEVGTSAWVASQPSKKQSRMWSGEFLGQTLRHHHHPRK